MKQILMVRHGILKIVIFYLRYLSRGTPYNLLSNAPFFIQKPDQFPQIFKEHHKDRY